jgi:hypothetical protein
MTRSTAPYPSHEPMSLVDPSEMPTQILGQASDDEHRTQLLAKLAQHDPAFQSHRRNPVLGEVANGEFEDALRADIYTHYRDPENARRGLNVVRYIELAQRQEQAKGVAAVALRAEMFMTRMTESSVREAIREGIIPRGKSSK